MLHSVRTRIIVLFAIATAVSVVLVGVLSYHFIHESEHKATDDLGCAAIQSCEVFFDYGITEEDLKPDSPQYEQIRKDLRKLCRDLYMDYLYVFRCDTESNTLSYIICVADDDANDMRVSEERSYSTVVNLEFPPLLRQALAGENVEEAVVLDNEYGNMLSWFRKLDSWEGDVLVGVDYSVSEQRARVFTATTSIVLPVVIVMLITVAVLLFLLNSHVFDPLQTIVSRMKKFSAEGLDAFEPLEVKTDDELGEIAEAFEGMADDIATYVKDIEKLTTERVQAGVEIDVARRIQLGMVPERGELSGTGFEARAFSRAARSVGGDFYDMFELSDGCVAIVVGDVSGKGIAAALFMAMTKAMVHDSLLSSQSPAAALNHANAQICASNPEGMFVTVFACVLDPATGAVRYANAGHLPPLTAGDSVHAIDAKPGVLLGLFDDADLEDGVFMLEEGECLIAFTDGVTEAVNGQKEFFGNAALSGCVSDSAPFSGADSVVDSIVAAVDAFAAGCEQFDDLTVVALRREPASEAAGEKRALSVDIASFSAVRDAILTQAVDEAAGRKACLACEEAFANIVSYSRASGIWFTVSRDGDRLHVTFEDDGVPFDPFAVDPEDKSFEDLDSGGMGIGLILKIAKTVAYTRDGERNILALTF